MDKQNDFQNALVNFNDKPFNRDVKRILVPWGAAKKIATANGCSTQTVKFALRGATDTLLSQKIRKDALDFYGGSLC